MNTNLLNIVKQISAEYGEAVLADPVRLKAFFSDLAKDEPKPLRLVFGRCVENGAYKALKAAPDAAERAERKVVIAQRLRDEHGLDITLCGEALDILETALFTDRKEPLRCAKCGRELREEWVSCPFCSAAIGVKRAEVPAVSVQSVFVPTSKLSFIQPAVPLPQAVRLGELLLILYGHSDRVNSVAYSPNGRHILSALWNKTVKVWDVETEQLIRTLSRHGSSVFSATYSPDGRRILSASDDKTLKIWDTKSGRLIRTLSGHIGGVYFAMYRPDGRRIVSVSDDKTVKVWDAESWRLLHTLSGHGGGVYSAAYSPDGQRIVSASWDKTLKVWDTETGQLIRTLSGHGSSVYSAAYNPDGRRIVSASDDKTVKIWDAETGQLIHTISGHSGYVYSAAYSPDGRRIVSGSGDGTVKIWDAVE